ncbi:MAG TPA: YdbH domain-containing protein [Alphaproteobacteria bacterium]|nr:YdbH domain-containing protein [Alphaproteobacteria bacterium]
MAKRKNIRTYAFVLTGGLLILSGAYFSFGYVARYALQNVLRSSGFPLASVPNIMLTPAGLYIDHISLDGNDFSTIDQINVTFNWIDLIRSRRVDSVSVKNISLIGEVDEAGQFKLAGWDATLPQGRNGGSSQQFLPLNSLLLQGITFDLDTPDGNFRVEGKLHIETKDDYSQSVNLSVWSEQKQVSFNLDGHGVLSPDGTRDFSFELLEGRCELPIFQASRLSGWVNYMQKPDTGSRILSGQMSAGSIKTLNALLQNVDIVFDTSKPEPLFFKTSPAGYPDISIAGRWNKTPPEQFELTIDSQKSTDLYQVIDEKPDSNISEWISEFSPLTIQMALPVTIFDQPIKQAAWALHAGKTDTKISGTASLDLSSHAVDVDIFPVKISASNLGSLLPLTKKYRAKFTQGVVSLKGNIHITPEDKGFSAAGPLSIDLQNISGDWGGFLFQDLSGHLKLAQLVPWAVQDNADFTMTPVNDSGDLAKGGFSLSGNAHNGVKISAVQFDFSGGVLSATPFTIAPQSSEIKTDIVLKNIDIAQLSKLMNSDTLSAQGFVSGNIPVVMSNSKLQFKAGKLASEGTGYFKYSPEQFPASLQGDDPRMKTVRDALSDFQFSKLSFEMNGPMDGHMTTQLKASGTSPAFGDRPIDLNLNLEGDLGRVLQSVLQAGDLSSTLRSYKGDKK